MPEADDARVMAVIAEMAAGQIDAIAFTSLPQVRRFRGVARTFGREADLQKGLERIVVAAVGPIVAAELDAMGVQVNVIPASSAEPGQEAKRGPEERSDHPLSKRGTGRATPNDRKTSSFGPILAVSLHERG